MCNYLPLPQWSTTRLPFLESNGKWDYYRSVLFISLNQGWEIIDPSFPEWSDANKWLDVVRINKSIWNIKYLLSKFLFMRQWSKIVGLRTADWSRNEVVEWLPCKSKIIPSDPIHFQSFFQTIYVSLSAQTNTSLIMLVY